MSYLAAGESTGATGVCGANVTYKECVYRTGEWWASTRWNSGSPWVALAIAADGNVAQWSNPHSQEDAKKQIAEWFTDTNHGFAAAYKNGYLVEHLYRDNPTSSALDFSSVTSAIKNVGSSIASLFSGAARTVTSATPTAPKSTFERYKTPIIVGGAGIAAYFLFFGKRTNPRRRR